MRSRESILRRAINLGGEHSRLKMDLLQEWFEPSEELQSTGLFCHDVPEHLPTLDHSDGSASSVTRTLPLLSHATTPTAPVVTNSLLRSHSVGEIHHLSVNQSSLPSSSRELPCIPRCESYRCQSVFPALSCSNADTSHVEIALEMPRYLLQEDESALVDETGVSEEVSAANKTSSVSHKPPTISSPAAAAIKPHWTTSSPSPLTTPLPAHRTNSSGLLHKASADSLRTSTPHPLMTSVMTVEPFQTTKSDRLHGSRKSSGSRRGEVGDAPRVRSCDSHVIRGGPLAVCFPQITRSSETNQLTTEGVRLVNLHATPISIAAAPHPQPGSHMNNSCERKKRRHGGGWPKGKSRRVDSHVSLPKPPATGYNIFLSEKRECVKTEHGASAMSAVSKVMGQMWSQLSVEEKGSYYAQAEQDRHRYVSEMKTYFSQLYKGFSSVDLEEVERVLKESTILENDDQALHCQICQISFASLNNKLSHFSGRSHRQSVVEHLHSKLALSTKTQPHNRYGSGTADSMGVKGGQDLGEGECNDVECSDLVDQLSHVATRHKGISEQLTKVKQYYSHVIETHADLQQEMGELEYMEAIEESVLHQVTKEGQSTLAALRSLSDVLASLGVEYTAGGEISIPGSFQRQPV